MAPHFSTHIAYVHCICVYSIRFSRYSYHSRELTDVFRTSFAVRPLDLNSVTAAQRHICQREGYVPANFSPSNHSCNKSRSTSFAKRFAFAELSAVASIYSLIFGSVPDPRAVKTTPSSSSHVIIWESGSVGRSGRPSAVAVS